jgi:hypothetical protein
MKPQILFKWSSLLPILLVSIIFTFSPSLSFSQIQPGIGIESLPDDNEPICTIPTVASNPNGGGPIVGEEVQDFNLFDQDGNAYRLSEELAQEVPVLLISGSLTCPVFRNRIPEINAMSQAYGEQLKIFIVYTVEAHPTDPSPYSGEVWITLQNQNENILFPQPNTYGERKALVDTLLSNFEVNVPILIDGPCNNWWLNYGTGANNAFLIDKDGYVYAKHDWFNQLQLNMSCDADILTNYFSGLCTEFGNLGTFNFEFSNNNIDYGLTNDVLAVEGTIFNNSLTDFVVLDIVKIDFNLPAGWETALCTDLCYTTDVDSIRIAIPPGSQQEFIFYFYTNDLVGNGDVEVLMRNPFVSNRVYARFYGSTYSSVSLNETEELGITVYPNPALDYCIIQNIDAMGDNAEYTLFDASGKIVDSGILEEQLDLSQLQSGRYILFVQGENMEGSTSIIIH